MKMAREDARETGQIPSTGANILNDEGQVVGRVAEKPVQFEMTNNPELGRSLHDTMAFLEFHSFEQATVLARRDNNYYWRERKFSFEPKHMEDYQKKVDNMLAERNYIDSLEEWAETQDEELCDYSDVMDKISEDLEKNRAAKANYLEGLKKIGIDTKRVENPFMLAVLENYDKKSGAMFRTRKLIHQRYNLGREIEE